MRAHLSTLTDTLAEVQAVGDTRGDLPALVKTLTETLAEEKAVGDTWGDALALVDTLAGTLEELEAMMTHGAIRTHWSTLWLTRLQRWRQ